MANLFDVFTVSFGKAKDARIAELETENAARLTVEEGQKQVARITELETAEAHRTRQRDEEITRNTVLGEERDTQAKRVVELEAELAPFREYVAANAAETEAQADGAASPPAQVAKPKK